MFFSVATVDLILIALIPLWDLTFNNIVLIHLVTSLGLSVLFSVKISIAFLRVEVPELEDLSKKEQRIWKTRLALGRIGTSVLHAIITILLAVSIVGIFARNSYFFEVFYKLWLGIVVMGTVNAFVSIPILLSFIGPL